MPKDRNLSWQGYAIALALSAVALGFVYIFLDFRTPFLPCIAAVLLSSWLAGPRPGLLSTVVTAAAITAFYFTHVDDVGSAAAWGFIAREMLFIAVCALAVMIASSQRRAESRALSQTDLLAFTLAHSANGAVVADEQGRIVYMNPRAHRLTGFGDEAIGRPAEEVLKIADLATFKPLPNPIDCALREDTPARLANAVLLISKDGRRYVIEDSASLFSSASPNRPRNVVLMFRDVTEQRRAEAELRNNAERFRMALEAGRLSAWEWNVATEEIECDELQYLLPPGSRGTIGEYLGAIHPDDQTGVQHALDESLEKKKDFAYEYRVVPPSGEIAWRLLLARPFYNEHGEAVRMVGISRDITEQKLVEQIVREGQAQFRSVAENATDCFLTTDERGKIVYANGAAGTLFGYARAELIGQPITIIIPERMRLPYLTGFARYTQHGTKKVDWRRVEFPVLRKDGVEIPVEISLSEAFTGGKRLFSAIVRDISERKRAEQLVTAARERLVLAQRIAGVGMYEWNLRTGEVNMSRESEMLYGLSPSDFRGTQEHWKSLVHPDDIGPLEHYLKDLLASKAVDYSSEYRVIWPDSSIHWLATRGKLFRDELGKPLRMLGAEQDITQQKKAAVEREALLASERMVRERLELAQRSAHIGTYERNIKSETLAMSPELEALLGLRPGEFSGKYEDWLRFIFAMDQEQARKVVAQATAAHADYYLEFRVTRRDNALRWLASSGRILFDAAGQPERSIGACHDITQRKAMEAERERILEREMSARAEAERANRLKDEFLATVSHELRTPLTAILGWSRMMLDDHLDPDAIRRGMESIDRNARAQAQLVEDLLDVSRIVSGKLRVHLAPLDLSEVVREAVDSVRPTALTKKIEIDLQVSPARVTGDVERLQQVAFNILFNAVKFSFRLGRILVRVESTGHMARFSVRDYGKGIDPAFLPNLFQRFTQEDMGSTRRHGGMGLGLAIVRHLVELHGGFVRAESEGEGKGATVFVELPLLRTGDSSVFVRPEIRPPSSARIPKFFANLDGAQVLFVEDDADTRAVIAAALRLAGTKVLEAECAEHAYDIFTRERPQAILSDISLPGDDGITFIQRIRALPESSGGSTPAVALTAHSRPEDPTRILASGFLRYLTKPLNPGEVLEAVSSVLPARK